jgi:enamine deaminase RidA (YjgF/YER057c/UK114 family)
MNMKEKNSRRSMIKTLFATIFATGAGMFGITHAKSTNSSAIKRIPDEDQSRGPLFSGSVTYGGLVYIAGKGYHEEGDITKHTTEVLNSLQEELEKAGSSMDKVLKVNVYLADLADYSKMNEAYRGRFGENPPVRTTVACYGGIPGSSLVEIDCIAALDDD